MKKISIALICAALSGCTSEQLKSTKKTERQALGNKQQADRQVERAQNTLAASTAITAAAANLAAKKQKQQQAEADLQQILCPQPDPVE